MSGAIKLRGVNVVVTGQDVSGVKIGRQIYDMPILADGVVRFAGEKVATVAAESEEIAEAALEKIEIEYGELSPLLGAPSGAPNNFELKIAIIYFGYSRFSISPATTIAGM